MQESKKNKPTSLACFEVSSIALGYRALDVLTRKPLVQILEAAPVGAGRFLILGEGPDAELRALIHELNAVFDGMSATSLVDHEILANSDQSLPEALYSLASLPLRESLVVIECETVSGLLATTHVLKAEHGLDIIEIKIQRSSHGGGFAFLTGSLSQCGPAAEDARTRLRGSMRSGAVEVIDAPNAKFREHFNFSGEG